MTFGPSRLLRRRDLLRLLGGLVPLVAGLGRATSGEAAESEMPRAPSLHPKRQTRQPSPTPEPTDTATPLAVPASGRPPFVLARETWGAVPPARPYVPHVPMSVILHHTGVQWSGQSPTEQHLRGIQAFHIGPEREWEDIAYHFLVDLNGAVWGGRPPEVRGNPSVYYDASGLLLICFLGNYEQQPVADIQLSAAAQTAAWCIRQFRLDPAAITAHRDRAPTSCPGANLYRSIADGTFAARVAALLAPESVGRPSP